jgi:hypothetical protein
VSGAVLIAGVLTVIATLALLAPSPAEPTVEVRDLDDGGRLVGTLDLGASGGFTLRFTHSMYGGSVDETYRVVPPPGPRLERTTVRTEHGGAAEYYARYGNMYQVAGGWIVESPPMRLERLPLRVDQVGQPLLVTDTEVVSLLSLVPDGHLVELRPGGSSPRDGSWSFR